MKVLVIDVGGTNLKVSLGGPKPPLKIPSGRALDAGKMARDVLAATAGWDYEAVSIGYPGPVAQGRPAEDPKNLAPGWVPFDYDAAFARPVRVINDAAMQALGSYEGGHMLFLGLGTGLGSALVYDGVLAPLELAHMPYRKGRTYEDYLGLRGYKRLGRKKWQRYFEEALGHLVMALKPDDVVLGGGNAKKLTPLPAGTRLGHNSLAFLGGFRLWDPKAELQPTPIGDKSTLQRSDGDLLPLKPQAPVARK